ncbi:restriction endonuclease subunit S [Cellulomonas dongxiuzhuiae]|uniref:restriction endonuclease subunit S n=1 Tax=Cellulomonas dongxiuzhuiae TaxID=2819979 RepID=UPI001AAECF58|nr:restriction endonuclease subunit S [Cellulomonas dongxiuzhuiae]MBO3090016.1 restriction endonuclease subunit S [Cellulomonas dongxiuzhuiae]
MAELDTVSLADLCESIVDCEHKTAPTDEFGQFYAVGTPAMQGNTIDYGQARRISEATFYAWTKRLRPRFGDLLLAREAPVGPVVRIPLRENVAPGQRTVLLRPRTQRVDPTFLYYLLSCGPVQARMHSMAEGSTVPHLNVADVRALELPTPPSLDEQRAIAEVLGALDDKIAANSRASSTAWQLAAARYRRVVDQGARPGELGEVVRLRYGKALPLGRRRQGDVRVYGSGGQVGLHDAPLVGHAGPVVGRKGTAGAVHWAPGPHFPIDTTFYSEPVDSRYSAMFCYYTLLSAKLTSLNSDSAVPGLNKGDAERAPIRIPDFSAVEEFTKDVEPLAMLAVACDRENTFLAATRDALLPALMSGAIRVKDAERLAEDLT